MSDWFAVAVDLAIIALLVIGIAQFRTPRGARRGNLTAALALALAIMLVVYRNGILDPIVLAAALGVGAVIGTAIALRVTMIQIPAMVAFQHGAGGIAACGIAYVELMRTTVPAGIVGELSGFLGLAIGAATFSGSMVASGKLAGRFRQAPTVVPRHNLLLGSLLAGIVCLYGYGMSVSGSVLAVVLAVALVFSSLLGWLVSIRIGGADMPVLISFLNATAGLAAAFCGIVIQNRLLIACGATVAASGSILTAVMCRAMNRNFFRVLTGGAVKGGAPGADGVTAKATATPERTMRTKAEAIAEAGSVLREAKSVIIVPGYGMALAAAQHKVASLARRMEERGATVAFAIHPVAGRMPGHMNVLLAEAEVDYDKLKEMDEINDAFAATDAVLVVGACDVVNPAAIDTANTPISGMPILKAHEAAHVLVCNLDERPGYSGVPNPLYDQPSTLLLWGDAEATLTELTSALAAPSTN